MPCICGNGIHPKRYALGYRKCLECGEKEAEKESKHKAKCTAPGYNKGPYQYVTTEQMAKDVGKK